MNKTAEQFARRPADAYLEAYKGEIVIINHDRYPDKVFELTARDRRINSVARKGDFVEEDKLLRSVLEKFGHKATDPFDSERLECLKDSFI